MSIKPVNGTALNTSNSIEQTLALFCPMLEGVGSFKDVIQNQLYALSSGAAWANGTYGPQLQNSGGTVSDMTTINSPIAAPYSVTVICKLSASGSLICIFYWGTQFVTDAYSGIYQIGASLNLIGADGLLTGTWNFSAGLQDTWAVITFTFSGTIVGSTITCYLNGVSQGSQTSTSIVNSPTSITVGSDNTSYPFENPFLGVAIHNGVINSTQAGLIGSTLLGLYSQAYVSGGLLKISHNGLNPFSDLTGGIYG